MEEQEPIQQTQGEQQDVVQEEEISEPSISPQEPVVVSSPLKFKLPLIIGAVSIVVAVGVFGAYYFLQPTAQVVESEKNDSTDTSNWETYRNEEIGFEFQHPSSWEVETYGNSSLTIFPDSSNRDLGVAIYVLGSNPDGLTIKEWLIQNNPSSEFPDFKPIESMRGIDTAGIVYETTILTIYFTKGTRVFIMSNGLPYRVQRVNSEIFKKFLSTFKFIESEESPDTSNKKTQNSVDYYNLLRQECDGIQINDEKLTCTILANLMEEAGYVKSTEVDCPSGFINSKEGFVGQYFDNSLYFTWCEPESGTFLNKETSIFIENNSILGGKTYKNEFYGIEIECPSNFDITEDDLSIICTSDNLELHADALRISEGWTFESRIIQYERILRKHLQNIIEWPDEDPEGYILGRYNIDGFPALLISRNYTRNRNQYFISLYISRPIMLNSDTEQVFRILFEIDQPIESLEQFKKTKQYNDFEQILSSINLIEPQDNP